MTRRGRRRLGEPTKVSWWYCLNLSECMIWARSSWFHAVDETKVRSTRFCDALAWRKVNNGRAKRGNRTRTSSKSLLIKSSWCVLSIWCSRSVCLYVAVQAHMRMCVHARARVYACMLVFRCIFMRLHALFCVFVMHLACTWTTCQESHLQSRCLALEHLVGRKFPIDLDKEIGFLALELVAFVYTSAWLK